MLEMRLLLFLLIVMMAFTSCTSQVSSAQTCPSKCTCQHAEIPKGESAVNCAGLGLNKVPKDMDEIANPESIDMSHNSLPEIPPGLPSSVVKLDLSHNAITTVRSEGYGTLYNVEELYLDYNRISLIQGDDFNYTTEVEDEAMPYIRKLGLSHNSIEAIVNSPFRSMSSLKALTLSHNKLVEVSADLLKGVSLLEFIDLSHNHIITIQKGVFKNLSSLKSVRLSWNQIAQYPAELPMLEWLDLSHNSIRYIDEDQKEDVYPVEILNLAHNPLVCDCKTRWLKELYDRREYIQKYINFPAGEFIPTCAAPSDLAGDSWNLLGDDVFQCEKTKDNKANGPFRDDIKMLLRRDLHDEDANILDTNKFGDDGEHEYIVNVMTSLASIDWNSAEVKWILDDPDGLCQKLYIQYYQIGSKDSTLLVAPVSSQKSSYVIYHLEPETQYKVCVLPAKSHSEVPSTVISPMQCAQFVTGSVQEYSERKRNLNSGEWRLPNAEEIEGYSKLLGFSFIVAVIITGACMFVYEVLMCCYRYLYDKGSSDQQKPSTKIHTE